MALTFNGTSSKLTGPAVAAAFPISMFAWVRPSASSLTSDQSVVGLGDFGGATEFAMLGFGTVAGDPMRGFSRNTAGSSTSFGATSMVVGEWQPCLVVFRSTTSRSIYFANGARVDSTSTNAANPSLFDRFVIGCRPISDTMFAAMDIAHVAVWNQALQDDDWLMLKYGATPSSVRQGGLVDYWSLDTQGATQTGTNSTVLTATDTTQAASAPTMWQSIPATEPASFDGNWTWFTEPRAVHYSGHTYIGWIDRTGTTGITKLNNTTREREYFELAVALQTDDHNNPAIYIRPDGRIIAFYSAHNDAAGTRYRISTNPGDISSWGAEQYIDVGSHAYANPIYLSGNGRLYLFFRVDTSSTYCAYSDDQGATWTTPAETFFRTAARPYIKAITNGTDRIDFYMTDGHPGEVSTSIYHCYAQIVGGALKFYTSDGGTELTPPISVPATTIVYDGATIPAWQWDAKYDGSGNPCLLFSTSLSASDLRYHFAKWTGTAWTTPAQITAAGAALYATEPSYAAGICFDADSVDIVYLGKESGGISEIEKWATSDGGTTWAKTSDITSGSPAGVKNARPIAPLNAAYGATLLWWRGTYTSYTAYTTDIYLMQGTSASSLTINSITASGVTTSSATITLGLTR